MGSHYIHTYTHTHTHTHVYIRQQAVQFKKQEVATRSSQPQQMEQSSIEKQVPEAAQYRKNMVDWQCSSNEDVFV